MLVATKKGWSIHTSAFFVGAPWLDGMASEKNLIRANGTGRSIFWNFKKFQFVFLREKNFNKTVTAKVSRLT